MELSDGIKMNQLVIACLTVLLSFCHVDGNTYAVAMLGLEIQTGVESSNTYEVIMINTGTAEITVNISTINTDGSPQQAPIQSGGTEKYTIESTSVMNGSEFANKTILFTSTDNFTLQVFSIASDSHTEGLLGIPIENLAGPHQVDNVYEYVVSTFCATSGYCQLAVTSSEHVDVKLTFPGHLNDVVFCIGLRYFRSRRDHLVALDKYDAFQIETTKDLTGTHIYSMGVPIVVYVGSRNVTTGGVVKHMLEQLTPSSHWGTKFGVSTLGNNSYGDILKIAANMPNTLVKMQGFPSFVINNRSHVVSRRLDKDMITFIEASNPIQVTQFTGLTYATSGEIGNVAMTTVPAVEHAVNETMVTCGSSSTKGNFFLLTDKGGTVPEVGGTVASLSNPIMYWDKNIYSVSTTDTKFKVEGVSVFGVVQCDGKSAFPLTTMNTNNIMVTKEEIDVEKTCIEGENASTTYVYGYSPRPADRLTVGREVLKFRVQVCGEAIIKLEQGTNNTVVVRLTEKNTIIDLCHEDSCESTELKNDSFNADLGCGSDMAIYWIKQKENNKTSVFLCFGVGPIHDKTENCTDSSLFTTYFNTDGGSLLERYSVVGLNSDAFFLMDLEMSSGCSVHVSDWRCEDRSLNCSMYDASMCDSSDYTSFATDACPKYCGKCKVDSYGKKFIVLFPHYLPRASNDPSDRCYLYVTAKDLYQEAHVSVATTSAVLKAENFSTNTSFVYDCSSYRDGRGVIVRSDVEVAVSVLYWINEKVLTHTVYPVDVFDTNYMSFTNNDLAGQTFCKITSEDDNVTVVPYFTGSLTFNDQSLEDGKAFTLDAEYTLVTTSSPILQSGVAFVSDKPIGVFCGNILNPDSTNFLPDNFNQLLPTTVWGTLYRIPALGESAVSRPFNGEVQIQALKANTFIIIDGDFDANYSLTSIGLVKRVPINLASSYLIRSNHPVAVGLYLDDATDTTNKLTSFHILPPTTSYGSDTLVALPMYALDTLFGDFGHASSVTSYFVSDDGTLTNVSAGDLTEAFFMLEDVVSEQAFGMTVVLGSDSRWFVLPSYSSAVPFLDTASPCSITTPVPGDGVDNDCDLLADEGVCYSGYGVYGEDLDIDGDFNDDCVLTMKTEPVLAVNSEPVCLVINKPADQCWTVCECKCSWVANYQFMQNLTTEEFNAFQQQKSAEVYNALKIKKDGLSSATTKLASAGDERQSAANIGYVGIGLFTIVFGTIFIMDISALLRDMKTFGTNFRHGMKRAWKYMSCKQPTTRC